MDLINTLLNWVAPPATLVMMACSWPALYFINTCEWLYKVFFSTENMEDKVVIITGASSGIGEQIAYEYARRRANLVLVARREHRLRGISEKARYVGAKHVLIMAADVVKEDDLDHLVNTASLGHTFFMEEVTDTSIFPHLLDINFWGNVYPTFVALPYLHQSNGRVIVNAAVESWLPLPRMSLYAAAKAALVNFYESLRFELNDEIGITIATHGWIGSEMSRGKFMLEDGLEMQWREERELDVSGGPVEDYAKMIVAGACRGYQYVKYPSWYDIFLLYRFFAPGVLNWTFRMLLASNGTRRTSMVGTGSRPLPLLEGTPPRKHITSPMSYSPRSPQQLQFKQE
ncbi:11-beta-hydroxysteroid dehydrogenase-like 5 [Turnera subulata]|uniref:11-beta-hydroxysteroid dehydrogenase-like 5 n=1 Tax=Turnera subulata TaxID=218843 RepID=A0A9Q0GA54_9ROSI|nr:11-beta-hydroxysteroid dehydrogenase-like 5 [Turnera subulata]